MKSYLALRVGGLLALVACVFAMASCTSGARGPDETTQPATRGTLIIAGGGLKDESALVWSRFLASKADGPIGIVPTSSGVADEAVAAVKAAIATHGLGAIECFEVAIRAGDLEAANDADVVASIDRAGGLWMVGGDQSRLTAALIKADGTDTPALAAMRRVLDRGGVIGGTSAGAAAMSRVMILGNDPEQWLRLHLSGNVAAMQMGRGLGFLDWAITEQHVLSRGRLARLAVVCLHSTTRLGLAVADDRAIVVDRATGRVEALGGHACLVIDNRTSDGRVWLLDHGDSIALRDGKLVATANSEAVQSTAIANGVSETFRDWWARGVVLGQFGALAGGKARAVSNGSLVRATLTRDGRTAVFTTPAGGESGVVSGGYSVFDAGLSVEPTVGGAAR